MSIPVFRRDPDPEPLLTFKEAMAYLRVGRSTLYRLMQAGTLRGHKVGRTWRFYRSDLDRAIVPTRLD